jgi:hypothetical protein
MEVSDYSKNKLNFSFTEGKNPFPLHRKSTFLRFNYAWHYLMVYKTKISKTSLIEAQCLNSISSLFLSHCTDTYKKFWITVYAHPYYLESEVKRYFKA